jgi:K(+)-stimulated pyrophosphate-energized sodium pump
LFDVTTFERFVPWAIIGIAILSLLYALWLRGTVLKKDKGTEKMQEVWNAIRVGADAYLNR